MEILRDLGEQGYIDEEIKYLRTLYDGTLLLSLTPMYAASSVISKINYILLQEGLKPSERSNGE